MASRPVVTSWTGVPHHRAGSGCAPRTNPYPPDLSWWAVKGRQALVSLVHLPVSLTGPAPSGSAGTSRRCQDCSHPHRRLPDQAVPSFTRPLRRPGGEGLSPPLDFTRLVAHVVLGPIVAQKQHSDLLSRPFRSLFARVPRRSNEPVLTPQRGGHDTPSAVGPPGHRWGHDLSIELEHGPEELGAHPPATTESTMPDDGVGSPHQRSKLQGTVRTTV